MSKYTTKLDETQTRQWIARKRIPEEITTTDIAQFGYREMAEFRDILNSWMDDGLPEDFYNDEVKPMLNRNSGYVFLTNSEYQTAMLHDSGTSKGRKLESFYNTPYDGREGFYDELMDDYDDMHPEDQRYMDDLKQYN